MPAQLATLHLAGLSVCCLAVPGKATASRAAVSARVSYMTTQTTEFQNKYVLTSDANGITTYDAVGECVPSLGEIERFVVPMLRELGVTQAMLAGVFVRASKWGDARLSDDLLLVVISDREHNDFSSISYASSKEFDIFIPVRLYESDFISPEETLDDFAFPRFEDWKVLSI